MPLGRPISTTVLARMRVLLFDHDLPVPLVAQRLSLSERVVQTYRRDWVRQKAALAAPSCGDSPLTVFAIKHVEIV